MDSTDEAVVQYFSGSQFSHTSSESEEGQIREDYLSIPMDPLSPVDKENLSGSKHSSQSSTSKHSKEEVGESLTKEVSKLSKWRQSAQSFFKSSSLMSSTDKETKSTTKHEKQKFSIKKKLLSKTLKKEKIEKDKKSSDENDDYAKISKQVETESGSSSDPTSSFRKPSKTSTPKSKSSQQQLSEVHELDSLSKRKKKIVELPSNLLFGITIHKSDLLPMDPNLIHPVIKVTLMTQDGFFIKRYKSHVSPGGK